MPKTQALQQPDKHENTATETKPARQATPEEAKARGPVRLLDKRNRATSPFAEYPGYIQFPAVMSLTDYQRWTELQETHKEKGKGTVRNYIIAIEVEQDGVISQETGVWNDVYVATSHEFGTWAIKDLPNDMPINVAAWAAMAAREWLSEQLSFRFAM